MSGNFWLSRGAKFAHSPLEIESLRNQEQVAHLRCSSFRGKSIIGARAGAEVALATRLDLPCLLTDLFEASQADQMQSEVISQVVGV